MIGLGTFVTLSDGRQGHIVGTSRAGAGLWRYLVDTDGGQDWHDAVDLTPNA